jgi:type I restriction enzyme S subunit
VTDETAPEGWASAPLGELLVPGGLFDGPFGSNLKTSDYTFAGVRVIRLENLTNLRFVEEKRTYISKGKYSTLKKHTVIEGDLLFGSFLDNAVRVTMLPALGTPAIAKADCFCIRPQTALLAPRYLMFQLGANRTKDALLEEIHGVTRPRVTTRQLRQLEILVPPLAEQKRIVAKVEELLAGVNEARARLARVPALLKQFRRAVLAAACEGRLTADWRSARAPAGVDDTELPRGWRRIEAGAAYLAAGYGTSVKCDRDGRGTPVLRVPNIASGRLDTGDLKFARKGTVNLSNLAVSPGDVLICRTNGSLDLIGKAALVPVLPRPFVFASYLIRLRLDIKALRPALFHLFLMSPVARDQIEDRARTTAGQFNLNLEILRGLEMPLPPPDEQDEIVRRVEALFKVADAIEKRVAAAAAPAEKLTQAILAKAFRGELVPTEAELARRGP